MLENVSDFAQITHGIRNIFTDIRNVPSAFFCVHPQNLNMHISWCAVSMVTYMSSQWRLEPRPRTLLPMTRLSCTGPAMVMCRLLLESTLKHWPSLEKKKKVTFQYFPTGTHLANRAERCIRTRKNHFISTFAKASSKFPMSYWNKLIPLAEITLNCLLPWQPNPAITAYHGLTGALLKFCAHHPVPPYSSMRHLKHVVNG